MRELVDVITISSVWQTPAVGFEGDVFLNAVALIETDLPPNDLKFQILRQIEAQLSRVRTEEKFAPRTIDIDILIYNDELTDEELWTQPHLAVPLAELYPTFVNITGEKLENVAYDRGGHPFEAAGIEIVPLHTHGSMSPLGIVYHTRVSLCALPLWRPHRSRP